MNMFYSKCLRVAYILTLHYITYLPTVLRMCTAICFVPI